MNSYNNNLQKLPFSILDDYNNNKRLGLKNNFSLGSEILCAKFDKDDSLIAAGCLDGTLQIYHLQTGLLKNKFQTNQPGQSSNPVTCLRWRPSQINGIVKNLITTGDVNGNIVQWHASSGKELERIIEPENQILCLDYDKNGNYLATAGKDCIIRIYDETSKVMQYSLEGQGYSYHKSHNNRIFCVKFLQDDSNVLISGSWDTNINIWDLRQKKCVGQFIGGRIAGESIDYKNGQILIGSNNGKNQLNIYDFKERRIIHEIKYDKNNKENGAYLFSAQFSKNNNDSILVGGSGKNEAKLFESQDNFETLGSVSNFNKGIFTVDYANTSNKFLLGGGDGYLVVVSQVLK